MSVHETLVSWSEKIFPSQKHVFLTPHIPETTLNAALAGMDKEVNPESVILIFDSAAPGEAYQGMVFTHEKIYWHGSELWNIPYSELDHGEYEVVVTTDSNGRKHSTELVHIHGKDGKEHILKNGYVQAEAFAEFINALVKEVAASSEEQAVTNIPWENQSRENLTIMRQVEDLSQPEVENSYERLLNRLPGVVYRSQILDISGEDPLEWKTVTKFVSYGCKHFFGIHEEDVSTYNSNVLTNLVFPEDRARMGREIYRALLAHTPFAYTVRMKSIHGKETWFYDQGEIIYDDAGHPLFLEGLLIDISEQKLLEFQLKRENQILQNSLQSPYGFGNIVGRADCMRKVYADIIRAAKTDAPVIIYGETGSGKDMVAQAIHTQSSVSGSYVPVNCGAIPEQLLESEFFGYRKGAFSGAYKNHDGYLAAADGGTLFLDEIGELPLTLQVKLLRALESKSFLPVGETHPRHSSFRLISATHQNLENLVREKRMRLDFYYRIHVLPLKVPPLRERLEDIPVLFQAYTERKNVRRPCPRSVMNALRKYSWPGNIRELFNFFDRYFAFGEDALDFLHTPGQSEEAKILDESSSLEEALKKTEAFYIRRVLEKNHGRIGQSAQELGVNLRTFHRKLKNLNIARKNP